jgi:hypothetical protein
MSGDPNRTPRSLIAQIQEIERLIAEQVRFCKSTSRGFASGLRAAEAEEHRLRLVSVRDTLLWVQQNEAAIKAAVAGLPELQSAIDFFDRVRASPDRDQIAVGHDHWDRLEKAARRCIPARSAPEANSSVP